MTATITRLVRTGAAHVFTAAGAQVTENRGQVGIYGHVYRDGLRIHWYISAGRTGSVLTRGRTWTRGGAWVAALAAAHKPRLLDGAR